MQGSTRGQIVQKCPVPQSNTLLGSKVKWGQTGVNQRSNCLIALLPPNVTMAASEHMKLTGAPVYNNEVCV